MQRLCYKLTEWAGKSWPAKKKERMNQLAGQRSLWKPPTLIIMAMNPEENDAPGIHESRNLPE